MPATQPVAAAATLQYPDPLARWGVAVERLPGSVRVVVPPVPSWRHLGPRFYVPVAILSAIIACYVVTMPRGVWVPPAVIYGIPIVLILLVALVRLTRRTIVTVSSHLVSLAHVSRIESSRWAVWPRADVLEIRLNRINHKLLIRIRGRDFVESYLGPNAGVSAAVADVLAAALRDVPPADGPAPSDDPALPPARPRAERLKRRLLASTGVALLVAAAVLMALPHGLGVLSFYALLAAAIPFGIAYGTQDKEFYL